MISDNHRLIIFDRMNSRGAYGHYGKYDVYCHRDSVNIPTRGEAWYCELELKSCDYKYVIFAKPISRFEISSLSMFDREDMQMLAGYIMQYHSDKVEEILTASGRLIVSESSDVESTTGADITYVGNDVIRSRRFGNGSYNIERSADGSCLLIQKSDVGRLLAIDYEIKVGELDSILGGFVGKNLQYSEIDEGILLKIGDLESRQAIQVDVCGESGGM